MDAKRVLIVGGGVAGLEAALALQALASGHVSVHVASPESDFIYRPLAIADAFRIDELKCFPLHRLVEDAGARLISATVTEIDVDGKRAVTDHETELPFDLLLLAAGATSRQVVPNAVTFGGPGDEPVLKALLESATLGEIRSIVFALPSGTTWVLPLYELALLARSHLVDRGATEVDVALVTPEEQPLGLFGDRASSAIRELFAERGIALHTHTTPVAFAAGAVEVVPDDRLVADAVVALPRLEGVRVEGMPYDGNGFVPTDKFGRVDQLEGIYAAGDITSFPIKQGGVGTQQADAAATTIAAEAGAHVTPAPFRPVLRGLLMTGIFDRYLYAEPGTAASAIGTEALWWPPSKIAGRYLAPFLAREIGLERRLPTWMLADAIPVEAEIDLGQLLSVS